MNARALRTVGFAATLLALASTVPARAAEVKAAAKPVSKKASVARTPAQHLVLPFIEDDYPKALELARQRKIPIFVDSWAPW